MIPTEEQVKQLWDIYNLPEYKRRHVNLVARVAMFLAQQIDKATLPHLQAEKSSINLSLLQAGALLHDIDKNIPKKPGEQHPDTGVRILREEGMEEVANLVKTHPLHAILDPRLAPSTWEEKLLYLADKMVKQKIITVDKRFALWKNEHLPSNIQTILDEAYPKVKKLEEEIMTAARLTPGDIAKLA